MAARVTIQDIADALNISRNTVSKAINNTGVLAEATRERVLKKAVEMGYKQFSYIQVSDDQKNRVALDMPVLDSPNTATGVIALLTSHPISGSHFASTMLDRISRELSQAGYSFSMHRVKPQQLAELSLPPSFNPQGVSGIMCIEMFDMEYSRFLCSLGLPLLFVDGPVDSLRNKLPADFLIMNNRTEIASFVTEMHRRGKNRIGFVGDTSYCISFYERYISFRESMLWCGLPIREEYCITSHAEGVQDPFPEDYQNYLTEHIQSLPELPDVFICANDFIALDLLKVFRKLKIRVPEDIWLCGFDNSPESRVITPTLTTIHIHSQIMGYSAVYLLLSRIKNPDIYSRTVYTETALMYRESTGD